MQTIARPIVLAIDAVGAKHSGAATVLTSVIDAALASDEIARVVLFASPRSSRRFELPDSPRLLVNERPLEERSPLARILWFEIGLARAVRKHHADVLLTLSGGGRPPNGSPAVAFLHQPLPFVREALAKGGLPSRIRFRVLRWTIARSARAATLVVVQTNAFRDTVVAANALSPTKVRVIPPSPRPLPSAPASWPESVDALHRTPVGQRLLYVGTNSPHKNLSVVYDGIRELNNNGIPVKLFVTFERPQQAPASDFVVHLGMLSPVELAAAYAAADMLVMPSLAETLGMPLLEAMAAGLPILAADRPYAHEVTGEQAEFFDPLSGSDFARAFAGIRLQRDLQASRVANAHSVAQRLSHGAPYERLLHLVAAEGARTRTA